MDDELYHFGILGMKWGIRRYQNPDGTLTAAGQKRYAKEQDKINKKDMKWAAKNEKKIYKQTYKKIADEINEYLYNDLAQKYAGNTYTTIGKLNQSLINDYNKKLAELLNESIDNVQAPSGRVVKFVAKRGNVGVYTALADSGYDMQKIRNGVWSSGRIAYRKDKVQVG